MVGQGVAGATPFFIFFSLLYFFNIFLFILKNHYFIAQKQPQTGLFWATTWCGSFALPHLS
jgi:hypothetical protein